MDSSSTSQSDHPVPPDPHDLLVGDVLLHAADRMRDVFTRACATEGLSMAEGRALRFLSRGTPQSALADLLSCGPSRVTAILQALEGRAFIQREPSAGDRRQHEIRLTPAGQEALDRFHDRLDEASPLVTVFDAQDREALRALLLRLIVPPPAPAAGERPTDRRTS